MSVLGSQALEETLRLIAEARERAERAAREIAAEGGSPLAFEQADAELTRLYKQLLDGTLFAPGEAAAVQLELGAAA